jgi:hypothetical protein
MPWNGTALYLAEMVEDGAIGEPKKIAGGVAESIFQPEWSPNGQHIVYVSDRSGWWNLYRVDLASGTTRPLAGSPMVMASSVFPRFESVYPEPVGALATFYLWIPSRDRLRWPPKDGRPAGVTCYARSALLTGRNALPTRLGCACRNNRRAMMSPVSSLVEAII